MSKYYNRVMTAQGVLEGTTEPGSGVFGFKGIPFAAPPVGDLRWKPPQPAEPWEGVLMAGHFGPRAMQLPLFGDMGFRSNGMSEDCLYLNIWTPAPSNDARLPVLVYFYGGGNLAGDGSESRYDGSSLASKGIVTLTVNYRLNVFGFLAHPELTRESPHHASGNYGYLDQAAALRWVRANIAAFGGDPERVTIAGESAGSMAVSGQMASPLAKDLIAGAIGSSGALMGMLSPIPLDRAERFGVDFAASVGASSLAELRVMPAAQLVQATDIPNLPRLLSVVDGYFLPRPPAEIFAAGEQAHVPLLAGWNSEEAPYSIVFGEEEPTPALYFSIVRERYGEDAERLLELYPAATVEEVKDAATDLASDIFMGYSTWKWLDLHSATGRQRVYRYFFTHPRPPMRPEMGDAVGGLAGGVISGDEAEAQRRPPARGAVHSADIEYAMGNLATNLVYAWTPDDYHVSEVVQDYYANFVKNGDPNGPGLPVWPPTFGEEGREFASQRRLQLASQWAPHQSLPRSSNDEGTGAQVMHLDVHSSAAPEQHRDRYLFLDRLV